MREVQLEYSSLYPPQDIPLGTLGYEQIRGNASYKWVYSPLWLKENRHIRLSADLSNVSGPQFASKRIFGFLQDAMPDRWGRRLMDKRERIIAAQEQRLPRQLQDFDYLTLLNDYTRMGAVRLKEHDVYVEQNGEMSVPPLARLNEFAMMAQTYESKEMDGGNVREEWLLNLYRQGSSLGGARPKANILDTDGTLLIAKIPSIHDDYDVALWEHFALCLAQTAGIDTAQTRLIKLPNQRFHTLLSKRFDRVGEQRIHFASAMTLTGLQDGASADTGNGYLDIVDAIISDMGFANVQLALEQLYRRVTFYVLIGNHDDHFRNHGFLLTDKGWQWAPAYDVNPSNFTTQSLLISQSSNDSSIDELRAAAKDYQLTNVQAEHIIAEVRAAVSKWQSVATRCGIPPQEQKRFAERLNNDFG